MGGAPAVSAPGVGAAVRTAPGYDYLLVAGPGRSGSTFLYRALAAHPAFCAPALKEGGYYRSHRRFERARRRLAPGVALLDADNLAWRDPALGNVAALVRRGRRVLVVVLLRRHRERAASVVAFRASRVLPALLAGGRDGLERAALGDALTPEALERIHGLGADVLTIAFEALTRTPGAVLDTLARLCAADPFAPPDPAPVNARAVARHPVLAAAGTLAAAALRRAGAHRALQRLKDEPCLVALFFRPARPDEGIHLAEATCRRLDRRYGECLAAVERGAGRLGDGLWFRPARGAAKDPAGRRGCAGAALSEAGER